MYYILNDVEPKLVLHYFEEICAIPHGSHHTKQISDYLVKFAKDRNLKVKQDEAENVIIWKKGSAGHEKAEPLMLQGHMDMVLEKNKGVPLDLVNNPIHLKYDDGFLHADGTTLGGDDGIAVAMMLAALDDRNLVHPPLECVFTTDEEIGMDGMAALDASVLQAKRLVNLDSEEEGVFTVGCAGGTHLDLVLPVQMKVKTGMMLHVEIAGLRGGHSGECIDRGRANAVILMGRLLRKLFKKSEFSLSSLEGGSKDNAIPRSCTADLLFFGQFDNRIISNTVEKFTEQIQNEYQFTDPDIEVRSGWTDMTAKEAQVATAHDTRKTVAILTALPNGLMETDPNTGRPQTSLNLGICQMKDDQVQITYLVRSSINSQKKYLCSKVKAIGELAGARIDTTGDYPAWEYQKDCPLRDTLVEVYKKAYGKEPKISITHGGLECGLLAAKIPGLQSVSLGPDMEGIHTPDEKLSVESVRRTWDFLVRAMEALA